MCEITYLIISFIIFAIVTVFTLFSVLGVIVCIVEKQWKECWQYIAMLAVCAIIILTRWEQLMHVVMYLSPFK